MKKMLFKDGKYNTGIEVIEEDDNVVFGFSWYRLKRIDQSLKAWIKKLHVWEGPVTWAEYEHRVHITKDNIVSHYHGRISWRRNPPSNHSQLTSLCNSGTSH